jgi:hypothetical protein
MAEEPEVSTGVVAAEEPPDPPPQAATLTISTNDAMTFRTFLMDFPVAVAKREIIENVFA